MSTTMKAVIHLERIYNDNLFTYRNTNFEALKTLFNITQKLILNHKHEIKHVSTIQWQFTHRIGSTLVHDKVIKLSKAKVHVYSDSVLCLGKMHDGIDGESFEFEWNLLQDTHTHYSGNSP